MRARGGQPCGWSRPCPQSREGQERAAHRAQVSCGGYQCNALGGKSRGAASRRLLAHISEVKRGEFHTLLSVGDQQFDLMRLDLD